MRTDPGRLLATIPPPRGRPPAAAGEQAADRTHRTGGIQTSRSPESHEHDHPEPREGAAADAPAVRRRRPRSRPLPGDRGHPHPHPGLRGRRHQAPGQRRPRDVHRPQAVVRRRRRADVPAAFAEDREARGRRPRRRRRAKLYYLRDRVGKAARVAERRWGIGEEVLGPTRTRRVDAEGATQVEAPQAVPAEGDGEETVQEVEQVELEETEVEPEAEAEADDVETESETEGEEEAPAATKSRQGSRREKPRSPRTTPAQTKRLRGRAHSASGPTNHHAAPQVDVRRDRRTRRHRRLRDRPGAGHPGLRRQAVPDPDGLDDPDARGRPAGPGPAGQLPLQRSPRSATSSSSTRRRAPTPPRPAGSSRCRRRRPARSRSTSPPTRTSSSASSPPPATRSRSRTATRSSTASRSPTTSSRPAGPPAAATCRRRSRSRPTITS